MSHYANYIKEREGFDTLETEHGFATYLAKDNSVYLRDIYVAPEQRRSNVAAKLADQVAAIAKEQGCKLMIGSVDINDKQADRNSRVLVAYGMRFMKQQGSMLYFVKEII